MAKIPDHFQGFITYLNNPYEKANEDLAVLFFRKSFGDSFRRQTDAGLSDGYLPGCFVLELKGKRSDWLKGLFQGIAYSRALSFRMVIVAAQGVLAVWDLEAIPNQLVIEATQPGNAPNDIGKSLAKKYKHMASELMAAALWNNTSIFTPLFTSGDSVTPYFQAFLDTLRSMKKVRIKVTLNNFTTVLCQMVRFFPKGQPLKAVRAFYSMIYAWDKDSVLSISHRFSDQATLGGEVIGGLTPGLRDEFKAFVEAHVIAVDYGHSLDDFFAKYDKALDAVDPGFRVRNGIFFTELNLCRLAMWFVKQHIPHLGKDYLVIDPACGSGNLVTNWRSPLELRHKVVSEIEPELLYTVEKRMKGDSWHTGKFTVVPKVSEGKGLNFLDRSADEYLEILREYLKEKGHSPDKPLAFLCNPPYRSDDDQTTSNIPYLIHPTILDLVGKDGSSERYCCFLAQMKLICERAVDSGLPGESVLLLFTKAGWLSNRPIFKKIRYEILSRFEDVGAFFVSSREFFDVKANFPIVFSIWKFKHAGNEELNPRRSLRCYDLTSLRQKEIAEIDWDCAEAADQLCKGIFGRKETLVIQYGDHNEKMIGWPTAKRENFYRNRRKYEIGVEVGGLPKLDKRYGNETVYGVSIGGNIGFMDDLTPCRINRPSTRFPSFRLNSQFMDIRRARCFSGPPDKGHSPADFPDYVKCCIWYCISKTFAQVKYPLWVDALEMWVPKVPSDIEDKFVRLALAITYADNECVDGFFPADNPVAGAIEVTLTNPLSPLNMDSILHDLILPKFENKDDTSTELVEAVNSVFEEWRDVFGSNSELYPSYSRRYLLPGATLRKTAGLPEIKDYANLNAMVPLLSKLKSLQEVLYRAKTEFSDLLTDPSKINYFSIIPKQVRQQIFAPNTKFDKVLKRRLAIAAVIIDKLEGEKHFGRTKLAKLIFLLDNKYHLGLEMSYLRDAAGPLDARAIYNKKIGIEALGEKYQLFAVNKGSTKVDYIPLQNLHAAVTFARQTFVDFTAILNDIDLLKGKDTDSCEIVATLFACWEDLLQKNDVVADETILEEFFFYWHPQKARFSHRKVMSWLQWMKECGMTPLHSGGGQLDQKSVPPRGQLTVEKRVTRSGKELMQ